MQIAGVGGSAATVAAASTGDTQGVLVAKKVIAQAEEEGRQAVQLIQAACPPGTGKLLNVVG